METPRTLDLEIQLRIVMGLIRDQAVRDRLVVDNMEINLRMIVMEVEPKAVDKDTEMIL
jgi:hypothetical protein